MTVNDCETVVAAENVALPAWLAVTVQEPAETSANVVPLTVQIVGVNELKLTAKLDDAAATRDGGATPMV